MREQVTQIVSGLLWRVGAIDISLEDAFILTSGNKSPIYIDYRLLVSDQVARDLVTSFTYWLCDVERVQADYTITKSKEDFCIKYWE